MGSFLVSCGLTNHIINEQEECYVIPIVEKKSYSSLKVLIGKDDSGNPIYKEHYVAPRGCYNTDRFVPIGVALPATYADYGTFDLDFTSKSTRRNFKIFMHHLLTKGLNVAEGSNSTHDCAVNLEDFALPEHAVNEDYERSWKTIEKAVWQNRCIVKNTYNNETVCSVRFYIVRKDAYHKLLDIYDNKEENFFFSDEAKLLSEMTLTQKLERLRETMKSMKDDPFSFSRYDFYNQYFLTISRGGPKSLLSSLIYEAAFSDEVMAQGTEEENLEFFSSLYNFGQFIHALSCVNSQPIPMYTAGQDYSNTTGIVYSKLLSTMLEEILEENPEAVTDALRLEF